MLASRVSNFGAVWMATFTVLSLGGCGQEQEFAPVSGTVTLDGKPLKGAQVCFEPRRTNDDNLAAGFGSYGKTDAAGRFQLTAVGGVEGAQVGEHTVWISKLKGNRELVPERYNVGSRLTASVPPAGTKTADFQITTP